MNKILSKFLYAVFFTALLFLGAGCKSNTSPQEMEAEDTGSADELMLSEAQIELAGILSGKIEKRSLSEDIRCNGNVEVPPEGLVSISLPMDAYVKKIGIYSGSKVKKGDVLAVMYHPDFLNMQQEYLVTGNSLAMLKKDLDRQEILAREDAASAKKLMAARTDYENILVRHTSLGEQLKMLGINPQKIHVNNLRSEVNILSPINGFVRKNFANTGALMHAGEPILELEDNSHLHIQLIVYEKDINLVRMGQKVELTTGTGHTDYSGSVIAVGRTIDDETRSADVHVHMSNADASILSGMYVKARILTDEIMAYALPEAGIALEGGQNYAFQREGNLFRRIPVETGSRSNGYVEIKSPEPLLDKEVVTAGAYYLNAGFGEED